MMTQRNVELQLQALDLIEKNQLALLQEHDSFDSPTDSVHSQRYIFYKENFCKFVFL